MSATKALGGFRVREALRQSLWFAPTLLVLGACGAALALIQLEPDGDRSGGGVLFPGGAESARSVLSLIVASMVTFVGTVFSITVIVLQLAASQFSPRALRSFLRDRGSQVPLGIFLATLVYAMIVLWSVRSAAGGEETVPRLAVTGAAVLVLTSLVAFVYYIDHVAQSIRVANIVHRIGSEALDILGVRYPAPFDPALEAVAPDELRGLGVPIASTGAGVVLAIDEDAALALARRHEGRLELVPYVGEYVPRGAPLARWDGNLVPEDESVRKLITLGRERTMAQDIAFGIRQLVDIAEKALSPGVNDPTTATQAIDQLHNVLRQLAHRSFPRELMEDDDGILRIVRRERTWQELVELAFVEIIDYAADSAQVKARLRLAFADLAASAPRERREPIEALVPRVEGGASAAAR